MDGSTCLEKFFAGLIPPEFLRNILVEAEEYTSNVIIVKFDVSCEKRLVRDVSVAIIYTPGWVNKLAVSILLSSDIEAGEFITRIYQALISKHCYIEASSEYVRVIRKLSCHQAENVRFSELFEEIIKEFSEKCEVRYSGAYELVWSPDAELV